MYLLVLVADPVDVLAGLHALIHKAVEATVQTTYNTTREKRQDSLNEVKEPVLTSTRAMRKAHGAYLHVKADAVHYINIHAWLYTSKFQSERYSRSAVDFNAVGRHGSPLGVEWREGLEVGDLVEVTGLVGTLAEDDEAHIVLLLVGDPLTSTGGEKAETRMSESLPTCHSHPVHAMVRIKRTDVPPTRRRCPLQGGTSGPSPPSPGPACMGKNIHASAAFPNTC